MDLGSGTPYDPLGWRMAALRAPTTGPERRQWLEEELLVWQAELIANGHSAMREIGNHR